MKRRKLAQCIYRVARGLPVDDRADQLHLPHRLNSPPLLRLRATLEHWTRRVLPGYGQRRRAANFPLLISVSFVVEPGNPNRLPLESPTERDGG